MPACCVLLHVRPSAPHCFPPHLTLPAPDTNARLAVVFDGPGSIQLDSVSLFPTGAQPAALVLSRLGLGQRWGLAICQPDAHTTFACARPAENVRKGAGMLNPWPFRADLLGALKALQPA